MAYGRLVIAGLAFSKIVAQRKAPDALLLSHAATQGHLVFD
jgi:hypothetical protein